MSIFKAYDIRGIYPAELDETIARRIGAAFAKFLRARTLVVGRDMRRSAPSIKQAVVAGITSQGTDVIDVGLTSTPMAYFAIGSLKGDGGLTTTASHNPPEYIGFKLCREDAIPLSGDTGIKDIERMVLAGDLPAAARPGSVRTVDTRAAHRQHVLSFAEPWRPLKVVIDTANGMGGVEVPLVLEQSKLELTWLYRELDGSFPNHEANPLKDENIRALQDKVRELGADIGFAFDGDADRCAVVDERGERVAADITTALIAPAILKRSPGAAIVYDLRSSRAVPEEIRKAGGIPVRERVGHAFIRATLRKHQGPFGGELSGHYYFRDNYYSDSATIAMVHMLNLLSRASRPLSQIAAPVQRYFTTGEVNFEVEDKDGMIKRLAELYRAGEIDYLDGITVQFKDWWFNVRKSNTEPLLRLCLEASTKAMLLDKRAELVQILGRPSQH
ncbi:MAG: phosphomannomutase/phosphoglucomutase [Planctomycetota bacterium]